MEASSTAVSNPAPGELPSCRLQLQPCCNTPVCNYQVALNTLISCFRCVYWGLELNSAGHRPSRTEFGEPCYRSCSMKIFCTFPTVNISNQKNLLAIYIATDLIWRTLKVYFWIYMFILHTQIPDFQIVVAYFSQILSYPNKPYTKGKLMYPAFSWCVALNFKEIPLWL